MKGWWSRPEYDPFLAWLIVWAALMMSFLMGIVFVAIGAPVACIVHLLIVGGCLGQWLACRRTQIEDWGASFGWPATHSIWVGILAGFIGFIDLPRGVASLLYIVAVTIGTIFLTRISPPPA